ncbi:putative ubiquitin-like modifier protein [Botrytis fragariae]|uniref:Putative ubiquitin-like modifier protein n=1 Tax=Botrytis fragariae TaxID=1964551 RepID=A0A8H6AMY1_9HELO|nr:putative ubiquitin-like modifier protein [Botrytis fragariae]KAF5870200.1 putative ubiquitin-like modifier protein [Botrytis fragariae]
MSDNEGSPAGERPEAPVSEHLNIKVTDNNNEVFFKIKRSTQLKKLMDAFCERQGKAPNSVRFLFDGSRVQATDSPDKVWICKMVTLLKSIKSKLVANKSSLAFSSIPLHDDTIP